MFANTRWTYLISEALRWKRKKLRERYDTRQEKFKTFIDTSSGLKASGFDFPLVHKQMLKRVRTSSAAGKSPLAHMPSKMHPLSFHSMQTAGDNEALTSSIHTLDIQKQMHMFGKDAWKHAEEPLPYTPLIARKLQSGDLWPTAPDEKQEVRVLPELHNDDDMTYRAKSYAFKVEYWLRRDLKAMPGVFGDMFNFQQFILVRVICSAKRRHMYIVWSTVHPGARYELEPILTQLKPWVYRKIKQRIKKHKAPYLPEITWVYEQDEAMQITTPRALKKEIREAADELYNINLQEKVDEIKKMGTMEMRLAKVPWYMPYLWAKEDRRDKDHLRKAFLRDEDSGFTQATEHQPDQIMGEMVSPAKQIV